HRVSTPGGPGLTGGRNPLSDTTDVTSEVSSEGAEAGATRRRRSPGLSGMLLSELQSMASSLGISGTARMRKGELVTAIQERQSAGPAGGNSRAAKSEDWPSATDGASAPATVQRAPRRASRAAGPPPAREEVATVA